MRGWEQHMGGDFDSVKIVHTNETEGTYRYLADFFRFIGFFVYNCLWGSERISNIQTKFAIMIGGNGHPEDELTIRCEMLDDRKMSDEEIVNYLQTIIGSMCQRRLISQVDQAALNVCADVFVRRQMMRLINTTNTFHKCPELVDDAYKGFNGAYDDIFSAMKEDNDDPITGKYAIYVRVDCARHVNELCNIKKVAQRFDTGKLIQYLMKALEYDPGFINVYVLAGFVGDLEKIYFAEAMIYYQKALDVIGELPYSSYIYYRKGRDYEKVYSDWTKAHECYQKAYDVNETNYRTLYKLGIIEQRLGNYDRASIMYEKILQLLMPRYETNTLHAIGYEYIYKALDRLGTMYHYDMEQPERALMYFEQLRDFFDRIEMDNSFFRFVYGSMAEQYKEATIARFPKHNMNVNLYKLYVKLGERDLADACWQAVKDEK